MENEQVIRILKKLIKIAEQEKQKYSDLCFCLAFADERIEAYTMAIDALERQGKKSCDGCLEKDKHENEIDYGYPSPCTICERRCYDNYKKSEG